MTEFCDLRAGEGFPAAIRPRLLLIDDDSMVGRFIGHAAEECGCDSVRTHGVDGFVKAFGEHEPDIVAVDLCVPGYDGIEALRFLAEAGFAGLVIIISGLDRRVVEASMRLGEEFGLRMAAPLSKPFRIEELAERISDGLELLR